MKKRFKYRTLEEMRWEAITLGIDLPLSGDFDVFRDPVDLGSKTIPNRFVDQPMEGNDAQLDGTPGPLTLRRYRRLAEGGAGVIWVEAIAISREARGNDRQLMLTEETVNSFRSFVAEIKSASLKTNNFEPYVVAQLTHPGRFGKNRKILFHDKFLDEKYGITEDFPLMSDEELDSLKEQYLRAAKFAKIAGFDAVDIKACHRYLLSELLAAHTREGKYGGSYENRTKLLKDIVRLVREEVEIDITVRLNLSDFIPYPYGWGSTEEGTLDFTEPGRLLKELEELGVKIINVTASTPYLKPHINRPYDEMGKYNPPEHPIVGAMRLLNLAKLAKETLSRTLVVASGFTWFRQFAPYVAAGMLKNSWCDLVGFGRMTFAYPDYPKDILTKGELDPKKVCITCNKCAELKAAGESCGCVVRDSEVYLPIYRKMEENKKS
ncbi:NADH:flavin oxidoreductase [Thermotoga sp. RQ2]|uniref:NADH:flavin oxidoreductase n=1 Tax=Thermotoga sp. (strain RQ2) TaxID=126740 RepID=UPI0001600F6A|nr:NADH:flavin oxidoreductase [Thermotoga sp. RQ2]ACB08872.1 NADH:flavin oxidoreductase/NADH oxidase [Thermotoga sp. RQ2]